MGSKASEKGRVSFINRELAWLAFAARVLSRARLAELPLMERVDFAGIIGMLHDEFFMKRVSGLKRQMSKGSRKLSLDGRTPAEEFGACRVELLEQTRALDEVLLDELWPELVANGIGIRDESDLDKRQKKALREYFRASVAPILTPLAVDAEHPFPFISNLGLNLAVVLEEGKQSRERFVRIKVPDNRPRWVPIPGGSEFVPLEQVIAANLDLLFSPAPKRVYPFRVTRGASGEPRTGQDWQESEDPDAPPEPGSIVRQVSNELKARRFAGPVRLQVTREMPDKVVKFLCLQLGLTEEDVYATRHPLAIRDLRDFRPSGGSELRAPAFDAVDHPRLRALDGADPAAIFDEIDRGDILLHHPYHSFDTSVVRFLESAAADPAVLAIKLTIYRTSRRSSIVRALADAARRGKQVAVPVEITARFDEAPNIAWGQYLEQEGAHVAYGVDSLKTHVKLALVVREDHGTLRRYAHVGTGNYHAGTARVYEDLGVLTADPDITHDVAALFNELTGATPYDGYRKLIVAPRFMRRQFNALIRAEAAHARAGRPSGIHAKLNQLQDPDIIRELYAASREGVPILLNVRGLCCLRPGVPGLSETIRVFGVVDRFLEHSRIYRFENGGAPRYFLGSADWMKRNLTQRVETIVPVLDPGVQSELEQILDTYLRDNSSVWDCGPDGTYVRRRPDPGEAPIAAQEECARRASAISGPPPSETSRRPSRRRRASPPPPPP